MQQVIQKFWVYIIPYCVNFIYGLLIFVIGKWVAKIIAGMIGKALVKSKLNATLVVFAKNMTYFGMLTFVLIAALNKIGVETNSFLAVIGAASLAVGLALQGSLANFAAGVMLVIFQPFEVNDLVEAGGAVGNVKEIQIFNTVIYTQDNKKVIVPNAKITADKIVVYPRVTKKS